MACYHARTLALLLPLAMALGCAREGPTEPRIGNAALEPSGTSPVVRHSVPHVTVVEGAAVGDSLVSWVSRMTRDGRLGEVPGGARVIAAQYSKRAPRAMRVVGSGTAPLAMSSSGSYVTIDGITYWEQDGVQYPLEGYVPQVINPWTKIEGSLTPPTPGTHSYTVYVRAGFHYRGDRAAQTTTYEVRSISTNQGIQPPTSVSHGGDVLGSLTLKNFAGQVGIANLSCDIRVTASTVHQAAQRVLAFPYPPVGWKLKDTWSEPVTTSDTPLEAPCTARHAARTSVTAGDLLVRSSLTASASAFDQFENPAGDLCPTFVWSSSNPSVAAVDGAGRVEGLASGTATISAACGGVSGSASVTVSCPGNASRVMPAGQRATPVRLFASSDQDPCSTPSQGCDDPLTPEVETCPIPGDTGGSGGEPPPPGYFGEYGWEYSGGGWGSFLICEYTDWFVSFDGGRTWRFDRRQYHSCYPLEQ